MGYFSGKVCWITGASSGIGEALAHHLAKAGARVVLSARREGELERVKKDLGVAEEMVFVLPLDLAKYDTLTQKVEKVIDKFGRIDLLVNNGGISQRSLIMETDLSVYERLMSINYLGTVALSKAVLPIFLQQGSGQFAVVTSLMGKFSSPYRSGYCGAKHALHGFFDALRLEHEADGVGVTMLCPGFVDTNVAVNSLSGDGRPNNVRDEANANGLSAAACAAKMAKAIANQKMEVYIGRKEVLGIYLKRFFPSILHRVVSRSKVR